MITHLPQILFWSFLHSVVSCNSTMNSYNLRFYEFQKIQTILTNSYITLPPQSRCKFHHSKKFPHVQLKSVSSPIPSWPLATSDLFFLPIVLPLLICLSLLSLAFFIEHSMLRFIHVVTCIDNSPPLYHLLLLFFSPLWLSSISLYGCTNICLSIHQFKGIWIIPSLWQL